MTQNAKSDADWARSPDGQLSTLTYCVYLGANLISSQSKKQIWLLLDQLSSLLLSQHSSRNILDSRATRRATCITILPLMIHCNNINAITMSSNQVFHALTKQIEVDYYNIRELICTGVIAIQYLSSKDQIIDVLLNGFSTSRFQRLKTKMVFREPPSRLREFDKIQMEPSKHATSSSKDGKV